MGNKSLKQYDLTNRKIIVTGANTGIGKATTKILAECGAHVVMGCRSKERAEKAIIELQSEVHQASLEFMELDLADFESIKNFVKTYQAKHDHLDVLINNAGVVLQTYQKGKAGQAEIVEVSSKEIAFSKHQEQAPEGNGGPRVVTVASAAHKFLNGKLKKKLDFDTKMEGKSLSFSDSMDVYGMTKLCNILFTKSWAEKLKAEGSPLTCYSIHPGWVATDLSREAGNFIRGFEKMVARTPEEGAVPSLWCACEPLSNEHLVSGEYYTWIEEKGEKTRQAKDAALASWLYDWSLNLLSESLKP